MQRGLILRPIAARSAANLRLGGVSVERWAWIRKDGGARGCGWAPSLRGSPAPRVSLGVGNGGIRENYLCTGDVHCAEAVVALGRLPVTREEGRKLSRVGGSGRVVSWGLASDSRSLEP